VAGITAQIGFDKKFGNEPGIVRRHATGGKQGLSKILEFVVIESGHGSFPCDL
jgi:hypothetical protein